MLVGRGVGFSGCARRGRRARARAWVGRRGGVGAIGRPSVRGRRRASARARPRASFRDRRAVGVGRVVRWGGVQCGRDARTRGVHRPPRTRLSARGATASVPGRPLPTHARSLDAGCLPLAQVVCFPERGTPFLAAGRGRRGGTGRDGDGFGPPFPSVTQTRQWPGGRDGCWAPPPSFVSLGGGGVACAAGDDIQWLRPLRTEVAALTVLRPSLFSFVSCWGCDPLCRRAVPCP